ncbi:MAG: TIGR04282 family arsenosugar biosynthesis glycosyltransferase [Cyclobacteriaceae bacterium]
MQKSLLIVFVKNLVLGTVKTRLARTVGDEKALQVYKDLLHHTKSQIQPLSQDKDIYYNLVTEKNDLWNGLPCEKLVQNGDSLGDRMSHAFQNAFERDYQKVVLIGSDCFDIKQQHIEEAFNKLDSQNVVIGPAVDGGYYLIGMSDMHYQLFINKSWSTAILRKETLQTLEEEKLSYHLLEELNDIDTEEDLIQSGKSY